MSSFVSVDNDDPTLAVPPLPSNLALSANAMMEATSAANELLQTISEKEKGFIFDPDHRDNFFATLYAYAGRLSGHVDSGVFVEPLAVQPVEMPVKEPPKVESKAVLAEPEVSAAADAQGRNRSRGASRGKPSKAKQSSRDSLQILGTQKAFSDRILLLPSVLPSPFASHVDETVVEKDQEHEGGRLVFSHDEGNNSLYTDGKACLTVEAYPSSEETASSSSSDTVNVVFDGRTRRSCSFQIRVGEKGGRGGDSTWHDVSLDAGDVDKSAAWARSHLIGPPQRENARLAALSRAQICLECTSNYPAGDRVPMGECSVMPRDEDDMVQRVLRTDQEAYRRITAAARQRMDVLLASTMRGKAEDKHRDYQQWAEIEKTYLKQRIWRKVGYGMSKGMKDQALDFNVRTPEVVPASWSIQVVSSLSLLTHLRWIRLIYLAVI